MGAMLSRAGDLRIFRKKKKSEGKTKTHEKRNTM